MTPVILTLTFQGQPSKNKTCHPNADPCQISRPCVQYFGRGNQHWSREKKTKKGKKPRTRYWFSMLQSLQHNNQAENEKVSNSDLCCHLIFKKPLMSVKLKGPSVTSPNLPVRIALVYTLLNSHVIISLFIHHDKNLNKLYDGFPSLEFYYSSLVHISYI